MVSISARVGLPRALRMASMLASRACASALCRLSLSEGKWTLEIMGAGDSGDALIQIGSVPGNGRGGPDAAPYLRECDLFIYMSHRPNQNGVAQRLHCHVGRW